MSADWPDLPIEVAFPDISRWAAGNTGTPYVWRYAATTPGPHVLVQALTHGNEVCGAIALDWLLANDFRPTRGTFTAVFANVDAYARWDPKAPFKSRCVDEDFNRVWTDEVLSGTRVSVDLTRARALRPWYDAAESLLDLHSMTDPCPPLSLAGRWSKGLALAHAVGTPQHIVVDSMMMVCPSEEHLDPQKQFVTDLVRMAQEHAVHVHLVTHCRKPSTGEEHPPGKYDIRGAAAIRCYGSTSSGSSAIRKCTSSSCHRSRWWQ